MAEALVFQNFLTTLFFILSNFALFALLFYLGIKDGGTSLYGNTTFPSWKLGTYTKDLNLVGQKILAQTNKYLKIEINTVKENIEYFHLNGKLIFTKEKDTNLVQFLVPIYYNGQEIKKFQITNNTFTLHFSVHHLTMVTLNEPTTDWNNMAVSCNSI